MTIVVAVVLAVTCVVIVAWPYLREPAARDDRLDAPGPRERRRLDLAEQRDRALAALKELEFDHRTGKVSDEDYREQVGPLRREAAEALRSLETASSGSAGVAGVGEGNDASMSVIEPPDVPEPFPPPDEGNPPEPAAPLEPYPPPDEGNPPEPAAPPEPYPPPDEADPPEQPRIPEPGPL